MGKENSTKAISCHVESGVPAARNINMTAMANKSCNNKIPTIKCPTCLCKKCRGNNLSPIMVLENIRAAPIIKLSEWLNPNK
jgi:hypothetical protein